MQFKKLFLYLTPLLITGHLHAFTVVAASNKYMVENTTGTSPSGAACYDFQTTPTCLATIANLNVPSISSSAITGGSTNYIQNTLTPTTTTQQFSVQNAAISSSTIANVTITSGTIKDAIYIQNAVLFTSESSSATTVNTYIPTNSCQAFTKTQADHRVKITAYGMAGTTAVQTANVFWSLFNGNTDLGASANNGFGRSTASTAQSGNWRFPVTMTTIDTSSGVGPFTYCVKIRNDDNATSVTWGAVGKQTLILEEIK